MRRSAFRTTVRLRVGLGVTAVLLAVGLWLVLRPSAPDAKPHAPARAAAGAGIAPALPTRTPMERLVPDVASDAAASGRPEVRFPDTSLPDASQDAPHAVGLPGYDPSSGPMPSAWTDAMQTVLDRLESPTVSIGERLRTLDELGRRGDAPSVAILKRLGNRDTYLNYAAVEALGQVRTEAVAAYLAEKLEHPDSRVIGASIRSLTAVAGEAALPAIVATLQANRERPDGHHDLVRGACVEALGELRMSAGVLPLKAELDIAVSDLGYDYASSIVIALGTINDPIATPILQDYIEHLERSYAAMTDNPMGRTYLREKIRQAESVVQILGR